MKEMESKYCKGDINQLRDELHTLIESENLLSLPVQKRSRELDNLIVLYYRQEKEAQELKVP